MRRIIALSALVLSTAACTPSQLQRYWDAVAAGHEAEAKAAALQYEQERAEDTAGHSCPEWYDTARSVGFSREQWREPLSRIMFRESRCNPGADNSSSTADGLTQIVRGTWLSSCPDLDYSMRYDPETNLACAFRVSGGGHYWGPWVTY